MELLHINIFGNQYIDIQEGWNFFKGSLEITNPKGSTSLFGDIKNSFSEDRITVYNGYLDNNHPHFLKNDMRKSETANYFLLTIASEGFIDISKSFTKKQGYVKMGPKRKKDKSIVLLTLCIKKDKKIIFKIKSPEGGKIRDIFVLYNSMSNDLYVEDVTPVIIKTTLTIRTLRFLKRIFYKKPSVFGGL